MSTQVQFRRGNTAQTSTFTGATAEITVDTDKKTIVVHDGSTAGGFTLARENSSNTAGSYANSAYATANSAASYANAAFAVANSDTSAANTGAAYANSAFAAANSASLYANAGFAVANSGSIYANSAFLAANNSAGTDLTQNTNITNVGTYANSAFAAANAATATDATQNTNITNAGTYANSAFTRANNSINANTGGTISANLVIAGANLVVANGATEVFNVRSWSTSGLTATSNSTGTVTITGGVGVKGNVWADAIYDGGVEILVQANAAFLAANTPSHVANSAASYANSGFAVANSAALYANSAFLSANNGNGVDLTQNTNISSAASYANSAFLVANTPSHVANSAASYANSGFAVANSSASYANSAFTRANNSVNANTGGTISGDIIVTGNLTIQGTTFTANAGILTANDTMFVLGLGNYTSDVLDLGFAAHYNAGTNAHSGLIRDSVTKEWYLFKNYTPEIGANNNIDINDASFAIDTLSANVKSTVITLKGIDLLPYVNNSYTAANTPSYTANSAASYANAAFLQANTPSHVANSAASYANSAFLAANTPSNVANSAASYANAAFLAANSASATDATQNASITAAFTAANAGFLQANSAFTVANAAFTSANATIVWSTANAAFLQANTPDYVANSAASYANSAFLQANSAFIRANNSLNANTGGTIAGQIAVDGGVYGNVTITQFASVWGQANASNPYSIVQVRSSDYYTGIGISAYATNGPTLYSSNNITFRVGTNVRDKDFPTGGTYAASIAANGAFIAQASLASTSNSTGSIQVVGGVGVKGNVATDGVIFADGTRQTTAASGGATLGDVLALSIALG